MLSYKKWKMLNESLGSHSLGISNHQNLGIRGSKLAEMGMLPQKGKFAKKLGNRDMDLGAEDDEMGDEEMDLGAEDDEMGDEELGDDEMDLGAEDDEMGDEEMDLGDEEEELGDDEEEMGDEMGDELGDEDEEFGPADDEFGPGDDMKKKPFGKRKPVGMPHDNSAFMRFSKRMKKECSCEDEDEPKGKPKHGSDGTDAVISAKDAKPAFLGKMKKKMKSGKCKMQKKESSGYDRPTNWTNSDEEFLTSMEKMYGKVNEKFFDGVSEDVLISPVLQPGDPGWAPATRLGDAPDPQNIAESMEEMMSRISKIEKLLKKK